MYITQFLAKKKKSEGILGTLTVRDWCRNDQLTGTSKIFILFLF